MNEPREILQGEIFEEMSVLDLDELSRLCAADRAVIAALAEEGVLAMIQTRGGQRQFAGSSLRRARTALRLQRQFELSIAGVALVLELMDELNALRRQIEGRNPE